MRILIAEDELLERKAMKKFIQDNFKDMEVVGEAKNGRLAIELARQLEPDIIFMDIKMPGINGLEAIQAIHQSHPFIKFILVSAYDTFEYAKQAMEYGIKDYILKPGKTEEIVKALFRVKKEIIHEENLAKEKVQAAELLKESLIRKLMQYPVEEEAQELMNQVMPKIDAGYFLVFGASDELTLRQVQKALQNHLEDEWISYEVGGMIIVLVMLTKQAEKAKQLMITRKLSLDLGKSVFIGIGMNCRSISHLPASYREAYATCFQLKTAEKSNYGFLQVDEQAGDQMITNLMKIIEQGRSDEVIMRFKENSHQLKMADKEKLYVAIQTFLSKQNIHVDSSPLSSLQTNENWEGYLQVCCMKINEYHQSKQSMAKASKYLADNYFKPITLEEVANVVNLSPNYFSHLFKETYGETFIEQLTSIRMERAKEFIMENIYSIKEVSFMIGYKDPNYFSRVFKRYYEYSPNDFRKRIFKK